MEANKTALGNEPLAYGVIRNLEDARNAADQARKDGLLGFYPASTVVLDMALSRLLHSLSFDDALKIAHGCTDYGGGYRGNQEHYEIYQHGIQTVINALMAASKNKLDDAQVSVLHRIGADALSKANA